MFWLIRWVFRILKRLLLRKSGGLLGGLQGKDLSSVVSSLVGKRGAGLSGLLEKFKSGGLGDVADSWVGTGANQAVTGEQVQSALSAGTISEIATKLGIPEDQAAAKISAVLPELVDKLTPDGAVPDAKALAKNLDRAVG